MCSSFWEGRSHPTSPVFAEMPGGQDFPSSIPGEGNKTEVWGPMSVTPTTSSHYLCSEEIQRPGGLHLPCYNSLHTPLNQLLLQYEKQCAIKAKSTGSKVRPHGFKAQCQHLEGKWPEQKSLDFTFLICERSVKTVFTSKDYTVVK